MRVSKVKGTPKGKESEVRPGLRCTLQEQGSLSLSHSLQNKAREPIALPQGSPWFLLNPTARGQASSIDFSGESNIVSRILARLARRAHCCVVSTRVCCLSLSIVSPSPRPAKRSIARHATQKSWCWSCSPTTFPLLDLLWNTIHSSTVVHRQTGKSGTKIDQIHWATYTFEATKVTKATHLNSILSFLPYTIAISHSPCYIVHIATQTAEALSSTKATRLLIPSSVQCRLLQSK